MFAHSHVRHTTEEGFSWTFHPISMLFIESLRAIARVKNNRSRTSDARPAFEFPQNSAPESAPSPMLIDRHETNLGLER